MYGAELALARKKKSVKQKESGELGQELGDNGKTGEVSELAPLEASESAGKVDEAVRTPEREEITEEPDEGAEVLMTEAEKRFKEVQEQREKERFRKLAATSYRQNVEVCIIYSLLAEPILLRTNLVAP